MSSIFTKGSASNFVPGIRHNNKAFSFASQSQYQRYIDCLRDNNVSAVSIAGGFSDDQLRCAVKAMGTCPPGYKSKCNTLGIRPGFDTPILNPAPGYSPTDDLHKDTLQTNNQTLNKSKGRKLTYYNGKYINKYGNNVTQGLPEMSGSSMMPSSMKDQSKRFINPQTFGFNEDVQPGKIVSATHQKITKGKQVPLLEPLKTVSRTIRTLQNSELPDDTWVEVLRNLNDLNKTSKVNLTVPPRISGIKNINGSPIKNIKSQSELLGYPLEEIDWSIYETTDGGGGGGGGDDGGSDFTASNGGSSPYSEDFAPFDFNNIRYDVQPYIDITPLEIDSNGNYFGGGAVARVPLVAPTPEVTVNQEDALGIAEGSELKINGKKVIIRSPNLTDIATQVNCAKAGVVAEISEEGGEQTLTLASCDSGAFHIANGCGGGTYKQVGDFHINRGFNQQDRSLRTLSDQQVFMPQETQGSLYDGSGNIKPLSVEDYNKNLLRFKRYDMDANGIYTVPTLDDGTIDVSNPLAQAVLSVPAMAPMESISQEDIKSTAGSGYRVGDRLRLLGGTPVNNKLGPLTVVCIDSAGSGYSSPANLSVVINEDGLSSGSGAAAVVTELDTNGGIKDIQMISYGGGYDINNPPTITIKDRGHGASTFKNVLAYWTADPGTNADIDVVAGETVQIEAQRKIYGENYTWEGIDISTRYVKAIQDVKLGEVKTSNVSTNVYQISSGNLDIAYEDPTTSDPIVPNRIQVQYSSKLEVDKGTGGWQDNLRPNSLVEVVHFPQSLYHTTPTTSKVQFTDGGNVKISYDDELYNKILRNGGHQVALFALTDDSNLSSNVYCIGHAGHTSMAVEDSGANLNLGAFQITTNIGGDGQPPLLSDAQIPANTNVFVGVATTSKFWLPEIIEEGNATIVDGGSASAKDRYFILEDPGFSSEVAVEKQFIKNTQLIIKTSKPWWLDYVGTGNRFVDATDPRIPKNDAHCTAMIGMRPNTPDDPIDYTDPAQRNSDQNILDPSMKGPLRIAKFIVTGVDSQGAITSMKIIDRGLYENFPSDLTYGIPLEYDYEPNGFAKILPGRTAVDPIQTRSRILGVVDPFRQNAEYGNPDTHPEYRGEPFVVLDADGNQIPEESGKHPDWHDYPEFWWDGESWQPYKGSPGAYDPSTYVIVNTVGVGSNPVLANAFGRLKKKEFEIDKVPTSATFGDYLPNAKIPGGQGARVFLTSESVPNCQEKGTAKESLGLPDIVESINAPASFARGVNRSLAGAGYDPDDISFTVDDVGDIGVIRVETDFPGIRFDSPNPGTLPVLGIPPGDYNFGMLCTEAVLEDPNLTDQEALSEVEQLYNQGNFGILTDEEITEITGTQREVRDPTVVMNLLCIERLGPLSGLGPKNQLALPGSYVGPRPLNDNNSIFHDGSPQVYGELYKYNISNIFGNNITMGGAEKQNVKVNIFESKRFNDDNIISTDLESLPPERAGSNISENALPAIFQEPNAWVDNYKGKGWAYLENGIVKRSSQPLVDTNKIDTVIVYDPDSGNKLTDLNSWDPFKGILPSILQNEIDYINEFDPVSYKNDRTRFGRNNIGKVWWDTSELRYTWYEQGPDEERAINWGKAFPGSKIVVCEWVESKALPENWNGNGKVRFKNNFVTERHWDEKTNSYELFYYYWVTNRTLLDDRIKRLNGRHLDVQTIAQYIADPNGNGLNTISFISDKSFIIGNTSDVFKNQESHLQIKMKTSSSQTGFEHAAWKLLREKDNNSLIPENLTKKLIDSLCSENSLGVEVPDKTLSEVEKYGIDFRPRQTMFVDIKEARRVMYSILNDLLADIKLETQYPEWNSSLPTELTYVKKVNWYEKIKTDPISKKSIRYDSSYKPISTVTGVPDLRKLKNIDDGTVIRVLGNPSDNSQLWIYNAFSDTYSQISIEKETVMLSKNIYTDNTNSLMSTELRLFLTALKDNVFKTDNLWNNFFFEMLRYAYAEQGQLSWAFKTSYLYVEKEESDLKEINGFKPDNFQKVIDYMNEVKPYNAKIREYKDGKKAPLELIGQNNLSDYDKPPYVDSQSGNVRILNEQIESDYRIMASDFRYIDYLSVPDKSSGPIRKANTSIVFDRTNWRLTEFDWNAKTTPTNLSIAQNISNLSVSSNQVISDSVKTRAVDRIFKFDPEVQASFAKEVNTYFNQSNASVDNKIIGNSTLLHGMIEAGQLKNTLNMVKEKVGGNWKGDLLNGSKFGTYADEMDFINQSPVEFGFDSDVWDENTDLDQTVYTDSRNTLNYGNVTTIGTGDSNWDTVKEVKSYEGIFNDTETNVTLIKNDETYQGFDGVTFQRVLYGENRPEELALFDPLETLIVTVTTSPFARGSSAVTTIYDIFDAPNATIYHSTVSVDSVRILNGGIGYISPTVIFTDDPLNAPTNVAIANAVVDSNGTVTSINVTNPGAGYNSIAISLTENITTVTTSAKSRYDDHLDLSNPALARVGQLVKYGLDTAGIISRIVGSKVYFENVLPINVPNNATVKLIGRDFEAEVEIGEVLESNIIIDKNFADTQLLGNPANISYVSVDASTVRVTSTVANSNITVNTGADQNTTYTADPTEEIIFYGLDTTDGWDTANTTGGRGSFDVGISSVEESLAVKVSNDASEVKFRQHLGLFGSTDYLRIMPSTSTRLEKELKNYDTEIVLKDASFLPFPTTERPGLVWVGDEKIQYARRDGNILSLITRGVSGTSIQDHEQNVEVHSADEENLFNNLNPRSNVWLDVGTRYSSPSSWDEILGNGPDGILGTADDVVAAWDELGNGNVTTSTVSATVLDASNTISNVQLQSNMTLSIGEAVKVTHASNSSLVEIVEVTAINGSNITLDASYLDTLDSGLFVVSSTVSITSYDYGDQDDGDKWDAATITGQTAKSLADRANADFTNQQSIMRFLHNL